MSVRASGLKPQAPVLNVFSHNHSKKIDLKRMRMMIVCISSISQSCHGILDISLASVERLHRHNIYPIVLLLKFRHHKQIREVCESHHPSAERISQKEAKEMYELAAKMEQEYKHVISGKYWSCWEICDRYQRQGKKKK